MYEHYVEYSGLSVGLINQFACQVLGDLALSLIVPNNGLKVHNVFLKVTFPPWLHPVKIGLHTVSR